MKTRAARMLSKGSAGGKGGDVHDGCRNQDDQSCVVLREERRDMGTDRRSCPIEA